MTNVARVKQIVESCKERLKREKDPEQRYAIATMGEEFNKLYMQLNDVNNPVVHYKKCSKCRQSKPLSEYSECKLYYTQKKTGVRKVYSYKRAMCDACVWPKGKYKKKDKAGQIFSLLKL